MINYYAVISLIIRSIGVLSLLILVIPRQYREIKRPSNEFTVLRWLLFTFVAVYTTFNSFALVYTATRIVGQSSFDLQNITSIINNVGSLFLSSVLVLIYRYKGGEI